MKRALSRDLESFRCCVRKTNINENFRVHFYRSQFSCLLCNYFHFLELKRQCLLETVILFGNMQFRRHIYDTCLQRSYIYGPRVNKDVAVPQSLFENMTYFNRDTIKFLYVVI